MALISTSKTAPICAVLAPFASDFARVREVIADVLRSEGIEPVSIGDPNPPLAEQGPLTTISRASFVIADITGENPNVLYELGFARALRIPVLLIAQVSLHKIPAYLVGDIVLFYDPADLREFFDRLSIWIPRSFRAVA